MRARGVDLWRGQGNVDFPKLASAVEFVHIRGSVGAHGVDDKFRSYLAGVRSTSLALASVYHAFGTDTSAADQAANAIALWQDHGAPIACDVESPNPPFSIQVGLKRTQEALEFCSRCEDAGAKTMAYTYPYYAGFLPYSEPLLELVTRPLWIASYHGQVWPPDEAQPTVPAPWSDWLCWQTSGDQGANAPGVSVVVDHNVWNGSIDDLRAWLAGPQAAE